MPLLTTANGTTIHFEDVGNGLPLVFLHGWLMSGRVWHYQRELSAHFRVITMDMRGHGSSSGGDSFLIESLADDVVALFSHLNLNRATIIGWSMGAQLALQAAVPLVDRLKALVLVGGTPCFCARDGYAHGLSPVETRGMGLRLKRNMAGTAGVFFKGMFAEGEVTPPQFREIAGATFEKLPALPAALSALENLAGNDLRPLLSSIELPVLLVHGTADSICLPGASQFMAEHLPDARIELLEGAGHAPFLSCPEWFNTTLLSFLEGVYGQN